MENIVIAIQELRNTLSSPNLTDWMMVIITTVYVFATILICIFNAKSAKATNEQVQEMRRQFIANHKLSNIEHAFIVQNQCYILISQAYEDDFNAARQFFFEISIHLPYLKKETKEYVMELQKKCGEFITIRKINSNNGNKHLQKETEILDWLEEQLCGGIDKLFSTYFKIIENINNEVTTNDK